jgi:hypothetical protein
MACALTDPPSTNALTGGVETIGAAPAPPTGLGEPATPRDREHGIGRAAETAGGSDPFDDFEDDDFDDEFDDDFEEDWEDDLTEDEEFPDTFGGEEEGDDGDIEGDDDSPFSDDPDFDED